MLISFIEKEYICIKFYKKMRIIAPSLLAADFGNLHSELRAIADTRAEWLHIDVMDGVFVPNISFGFPVFSAVKKASDLFMDVHLMIVNPQKYAARFVEAGADMVTFHLEAVDNPRECIDAIRRAGARVGISIKPKTPAAALAGILPEVDMVLIMSVEPGFGGQAFMPEAIDKVCKVREMARGAGLDTMIEVDGGISSANAGALFAAGADVLVAGSSVFRAADYREAINEMLEAQ